MTAGSQPARVHAHSTVPPGPGDDSIGTALSRRALGAREELKAVAKRLEDSRARLRETKSLLGTGRSTRQLMHDSQLARLETMPVIEQAKGVLIAQTGCDADQAFALLRPASQRANVPVRDLATDIVGRASSGRPSVPGELPAPRARQDRG